MMFQLLAKSHGDDTLKEGWRVGQRHGRRMNPRLQGHEPFTRNRLALQADALGRAAKMRAGRQARAHPALIPNRTHIDISLIPQWLETMTLELL